MRLWESFRHVALAVGISTAGCGPMFAPMSVHLDEEEQRQVDGVWENVMTPVDRVGREALLDTLMTYWLFQMGVDRLRLVSEKYLSHGKVVMEVDCARATPESDQFTVTVLDERGRTVRRERYTRRDVEESVQALWSVDSVWGRQLVSATQPSSAPASPARRISPAGPNDGEQERLRAERERRARAVLAATRPARVEHDR